MVVVCFANFCFSTRRISSASFDPNIERASNLSTSRGKDIRLRPAPFTSEEGGELLLEEETRRLLCCGAKAVVPTAFTARANVSAKEGFEIILLVATLDCFFMKVCKEGPFARFVFVLRSCFFYDNLELASQRLQESTSVRGLRDFWRRTAVYERVVLDG